MEAVKDVSNLIYTKARGGRFRWLTISTLMLAIGMLLHLVSPSVAGFTPNWMIATYVVAILLTKPSYRQCLGICMVAALMEVFTSKSAFPYGDFASEFAGAYVAGFFAHSVPPFKIGRFSLRPAIAGFITTLVSGFIFVSILTVVVGIPISVYLYGILPMVALVGVGNAIITPFLYFPALKLFRSMQYMTESDVEDSNHSHLNLQQKGNGVISVEHLSYSYLFSNAPALENVSINIEQGSFVVITGPNGAGKTTLLMSMAGAIPHYYGGTMKGMVFTGGKAVTQTGIADLASSIGVILSDYSAQIVTMTVGEEMAFTLENHGFSPEEIRRRSEEALRKVHLDGLEERKVSTLSGGQRQRVAFARALAPNPELLLLDEPFAAIDAKVRQELRSWLREMITRVGITSIFVTHDQDEAIEVADEIIITNHGHIEQAGTPIEIYSQPKTPFVTEFMGSPTRISNITSFHGYEELGEGLHAVVRPEHVSVTKKTEQSRFSSSVEEGVVERVMFRGREVELHVRVHDVLLVANRRLEEASITEGERVNVFIYQVFAFPAGENGTQNVNIVENANIETEKLFYI